MLLKKYHQSSDQITEELEIVLQAKRNPDAFKPLYLKYHEPIFRFIYQRIDNKDLAFDTASQVFLKALQNINRYEFKGVPFSSWLYRIAKSEVYQLIKDNKAERTLNVDSLHLINMIEELESNNERKEDSYRDKLILALSNLPEEDLQLIEMRFFENMSFKQIGEILEITENNSKVKTYRILEKLKKVLIAKI